jgi:TonB family protein
MFVQTPTDTERRRRSLLISLLLHGVLLGLLLYRPAAKYLIPRDVAYGSPHSAGSVSLVYVAPPGLEAPSETAEVTPPKRIVDVSAKVAAPKRVQPKQENANPAASPTMERAALGGSLTGHVPGAPIDGDEVRPALPEVFPDPPVSRADLPPGIQGDVIVEVTIDASGNVVELKLTQGIGYGIDEKVMAVLRQWHFRPATRDGVTVASQHLVHFHYPA